MYQSSTIHVDGIELDVRADASGVTIGRTVDGIYASDLLLTPTQARTLATALNTAADACEVGL